VSILNLLQGLTAPKNDLGVISTDGPKDSITGSKQNDKLTYDATKFDAGETFVELDGGQGFDTLTITLTASQHAAMKAELQAKAKGFLGGLKGGNFDLIGDLLNALAGQKFVEIASLGLRFKAWESVKFDVVPDPVPVEKIAAPTWIDEHGRGNFLAADKSVDLDLNQSKLELEENSPASGAVQPSSVDAYFAGGDAVTGFSFAPSIYIGSAFSDRLIGNDSSNIFSGEGGNDFLSGRGGNDELRGEDGDDVIDGGAGDDWVVGGNGDDTFSYGAGDGSDAVAGGAGIDTLAVKLNADTGKRYVFQGTATGFDFSVQTVSAVTEATSSVSGVERAELSLGNDEALLLIGDTGLTQVVANGGNMLSLATMTGSTKVTANLGGGDDTFLGGGHAVGANVDGGEGSEASGDVANYSQIGGPVALDLAAGTAVRNGVTDIITNFEHAVGTVGADSIVGSTEANFLSGEGGNDTLTGAAGNDTLNGGDGNDSFLYSSGNGSTIAGDGNDTVDGGAGIDKLVVSRLTEHQNRYNLTATSNGFDFGIDHDFNGWAEETVTTSNVEQIDVNLKNNEQVVVSGNFSGLNSINVTGDEGGQSLFLFGLGSATAVTANLLGGNDEVYGGAHPTGAVVNGGEGSDWLNYGLISGPINADLAAGTVVRNGVTDKMTNFENVSGTGLADTIQGTSGANSIYGQGGNDIINGREGGDYLDGGDGHDNIQGGAGNDTIIGGNGSDTITTGSGADVVRSGATTDWINNTSDTDIDQFIFDAQGLDAFHGGVFVGDQFLFDTASNAAVTLFFQDIAEGCKVWAVADFDGNAATMETAGALVYGVNVETLKATVTFDFI
jgi:Ca2+-binding RTX toxin-like protein